MDGHRYASARSSGDKQGYLNPSFGRWPIQPYQIEGASKGLKYGGAERFEI